MRPSLPRLAALALAALVAACGGDSKPSLPPLAWTWVPITGSVCADGSPTGIGIESPAAPSSNVLVFLDGGGACWDTNTCWLYHTASTLGPFGEAQLDAKIRDARAGSVLDRDAPGNPYKDFTFVFVPYCTADVHSGDNTITYGLGTPALHHNGRVNVSNAFEYLATALDTPSKVVVSGSSAGGFGSLLAFTKAKAAWPSAQAYLVDDSGPPLANIPTATIAAWVLSWDMGTAVAEVCGAACAGDPPTLAPIIPTLAENYRDDRFALLSSTQDATIRFFFSANWATFPPPQMSALDFENALRDLATAMNSDTSPPGVTHAFIVPGTTHPMLDRPGSYTSQGVTLFEWLRRQVEDEPTWSAAIPPPP